MSELKFSDNVDKLKDFYFNLYFREVKVKPSKLKNEFWEGNYFVSSYVDNNNQTIGLYVIDYIAACAFASALSEIPPDGMKETIEASEFPKEYQENLYEVLNISSRIFTFHGKAQVAIDKLYQKNTDLPDNVIDFISNSEMEGFEITLEDYGGGQFILIENIDINMDELINTSAENETVPTVKDTVEENQTDSEQSFSKNAASSNSVESIDTTTPTNSPGYDLEPPEVIKVIDDLDPKTERKPAPEVHYRVSIVQSSIFPFAVLLLIGALISLMYFL